MTNRKRGKQKRAIILLVALCNGLLLAAALGAFIARPTTAQTITNESPDGVWADSADDLSPADEAAAQRRLPAQFRTLDLDAASLAARLDTAPPEMTPAEPAQLYLPLPDGRYLPFHVTSAPVMAPELAARYPQIRTYSGVAVDDPTMTARLDWTPRGFHGMIMGGDGRVFIDPLEGDGEGLYISYAAADFVPDLPPDFGRRPDVETAGPLTGSEPAGTQSTPLTGTHLRTYRLAMAATAEFTAYHDALGPGDPVSDALSAIVTTINRVSGIYEREVAVRLELVANNDQIIFTAVNDPYTDIYDLSQNQAVIDTVIGSANYDIGHVVSTDNGGLATLGVVCVNGLKARGATGLPDPIGDPFDVDYVAHEIGHQFGANHTFNTNHPNCVGQRAASNAYEPGSGSTIMAYAGICGSHNLQANSDDYFHGASISEIVAFTTAGSGSTCGQLTATGNTLPVVEAGGSYTIPVNTPFALSGSAADAEQSALTYGWEQFDLGIAVDPLATPNPAFGDYPIFRSFPPTTDPTRTFPRWDDIVNNSSTIGEVLPTYERTLHFRLTARDLAAPAGGVAFDTTTVQVVDTAGPFLVTAPNTAVTWQGGGADTVTWDVAGSDQNPVNCALVDILLSVDGGYTYPTVLAGGVANDGSQLVTVPNIAAGAARVQVRCRDNIFFDISNVDFTIEQSAGNAVLLPLVTASTPALIAPGELTYTITVSNDGDIAAGTTITDNFPAGLTNPVCDEQLGNLLRTEIIPAGGAVSYQCDLEAPDYLQMSLRANQTLVPAGTPVTYTLSITNTSPAVALSGLDLQLPGVTGCSPPLNSISDLAPSQAASFVCGNQADLGLKTATAAAQLQISNVAAASSPADSRGAQTSPPVNTTLFYAATDSVLVEVGLPHYLPLLAR